MLKFIALLGVVFALTVHGERALPVLSKIKPSVQAAFGHSSHADVLVILKDQTPLSDTRHLATQLERGRYVYESLTRTAQRSQRELRSLLDAQGISYRAHYLVNMIAIFDADAHLVRALAARDDVARIELNPRVKALSYEVEQTQQTTIPWNLKLINADKVWELGITGKGVVVAGADTGVDWLHPALITQYRGYNSKDETVDHNYNWFDAVEGAPEPFDPSSHGTITLGVVVGDEPERIRTGVAFESQWIACRNMEYDGYGTPERYIGCMEFFLAPFPLDGDPMTQGDPSKAPQVINNSWACPPHEGCEPETLKQAVENVRAGGILFVAAAGNEGPSCGSIRHPPAIYEAAFTVGATTRDDTIALFSSRGPVTLWGTEQIEPDVSAPGIGIRGPVPGGSYRSAGGTSLAAPHVTGIAALMMSAAPHLKGRVEVLEELIRQTAIPKAGDCGGDRPNNSYGWGRVDALAAVQAALEAR
ncbi:MAG: S8 family serine peptidase [Candidatus Bipolaricaulota bacterium]|nr:S8 family serine peptidase [Candidatus Bipolaricaulota bacterium]